MTVRVRNHHSGLLVPRPFDNVDEAQAWIAEQLHPEHFHVEVGPDR